MNSQIPSLKIRDFALCCAALASALESTTKHLSWAPNSLSTLALSVFQEFSDTYCDGNYNCSLEVAESEFDLRGLKNEKKFVIKLIPEVLPFLKGKINESAIDTSNEDDGISAASASVPVAYAIVAAYQFRWFVTQVIACLLRGGFFNCKFIKRTVCFVALNLIEDYDIMLLCRWILLT